MLDISELLALPAIIVVVGLLGVVFSKGGNLILTDNRAKLLNSVFGGLVAIIVMAAVAPPPTELFPDTDPNLINITLEGPLGTNVETSNGVAIEAQERINALIAQDPIAQANVREVINGVGVSADADFGGGASSSNRSRLTLNMVDFEDRPASSKETFAALRDQLKGIPGISIEFAKDNAGPPTGAPVNIEVSGDDFNQIIRIVREVKQMLIEAADTGVIPDLVDVADNLNTGRPELQVDIDREAAARFGLNTNQIAGTVRSAINGFEAGKYRDGEDEYDIRVRLAEADRANLESLRNLTILEEGTQIPISAVADFDVRGGLGSITRLDLQRVATVSGNVSPGANGNAVLAQVQGHLAEYEASLPPGYQLAYTGASEEQADAFGFLGNALLIAVALIFMIMVAQFNSVSYPFIIMVAVGLSFFGVMLGLILTRTPFGLMTFIGVISLAGIVVNNNIVLIDYIEQLRERGLSKIDAIVEGGATRLRPVLLTALTTVIGLIPLTFGINIDFVGLLTDLRPNFQIGSANTQFWGPMGTSIIAGLTFATFLTLVIVPVMYSSFNSLAQHMGAALRSRRASDEAADLLTGDGFPTDGVPAQPAGTPSPTAG